MIELTVIIGASVQHPKGLEYEYKMPGKVSLGEAVAAAKVLHPDWHTISAILTRPKPEASTGPAG